MVQGAARPPDVLSLLFAALLLIPYVYATCYWANSTAAPDSQYSIAPDDTPCFPNQNASVCCGTGWTCLSDGVCYIEQDSSAFYYRGTCTDKTWNSQQCPGWCFAQNSNTSYPMTRCLNGNNDWYCCSGDDTCDCVTGKYAVKLGSILPTTVTVIGAATWPGQSTSTSSTSSMSTTSAITSTTSSGPSSAQTGSAGATSSSTSSTTGLAAGLGAAVGVVALIALALAFLLLRNRRQLRQAKADPPMAPVSPGGYDGLIPQLSNGGGYHNYGGDFDPSSELSSDGHGRPELFGEEANGLAQYKANSAIRRHDSTGVAEMDGQT